MALFARYGALLRGTGAAPAVAASLLGRLALGTTGLALLLLVRAETGSYAAAGLVAAGYAVAFAACAPVRARSADRRGPVRVLVLCALAHPVVLLALVLLAQAGAGTLAPSSACNARAAVAGGAARHATEALAWSGSAIFAGAALGNVASGLLVEHAGVRAALLLTGVAGALGLVATLARRQVLAPA